ncbi:MAG: gliding motility-associated C-terminal domain-containing protein [Flavobacteriales bacterium]
MKKAVLSLLIVLLSLATQNQAFAQSSDCNTAISVCSELYEQSNSPSGTGNVFEQSPGSCQTFGEFNSAWYVFTVQENGVLNFVLEPNNLNDDYDWSLYEITTGGCGGINNGQSPEVSCNSYGETFGTQGTTGISSALGGSGNSNGPGNLAGPPFNSDLNVQQGEVYALVVMNYSATLNGYSLDFDGGTASIFDNSPPSVTGYTIDCDHESVTFELSENILTDYLTLGNLSMIAGGNDIPMQGVTFPAGEFTNTFTINSTALANLSAAVEVFFTNPPEDLCGNTMEPATGFQIDLPASVDIQVTNACEGEGGAAEIVAENITDCGDFVFPNTWNASTNCNSLTVSDLTPGAYNFTFTSPGDGCTQNLNFTIANSPLPVELGPDQELCDLSGSFTVQTTGNVISWSGDAGVSFFSPNAATTLISAPAGTYTINVEASSGQCTNTDTFEITFNNPPAVSITTAPISCYQSCDGEVNIADASGANITVTIDDMVQSGTSANFTNLCHGSYEVMVAFSAQCTAAYSFELSNPAQVTSDFTFNPGFVFLENTNVVLTEDCTNADSIFWSVIGLDDFTSTDTVWNLELPREPGYYQIQLIAQDENGCMDVEVKSIQVKDDFRVFIPNSFSPNSDGLNDFFIPVISYEPEVYELTIFDRWGGKVFYSTDWKQAWMGDNLQNGYYSSNDAFQWFLKVKGEELEILEYTGSVILLR